MLFAILCRLHTSIGGGVAHVDDEHRAHLGERRLETFWPHLLWLLPVRATTVGGISSTSTTSTHAVAHLLLLRRHLLRKKAGLTTPAMCGGTPPCWGHSGKKTARNLSPALLLLLSSTSEHTCTHHCRIVEPTTEQTRGTRLTID